MLAKLMAFGEETLLSDREYQGEAYVCFKKILKTPEKDIQKE